MRSFLLIVVLLGGCEWLDEEQIVCTEDAECFTGYACDVQEGHCVFVGGTGDDDDASDDDDTSDERDSDRLLNPSGDEIGLDPDDPG